MWRANIAPRHGLVKKQSMVSKEVGNLNLKLNWLMESKSNRVSILCLEGFLLSFYKIWYSIPCCFKYLLDKLRSYDGELHKRVHQWLVGSRAFLNYLFCWTIRRHGLGEEWKGTGMVWLCCPPVSRPLKSAIGMDLLALAGLEVPSPGRRGPIRPADQCRRWRFGAGRHIFRGDFREGGILSAFSSFCLD